MPFIADFHIHSSYSRATAKDISFESLAFWGQLKGISLIGTGDCTHPAWVKEMKAKLIEDGSGLLSLKKAKPAAEVPDSCKSESIHFIITGEISTIYKYGEKTRKVHHVVCFPSLDSVEKFNKKLESIGNIRSDGRPILGLDSRDLLEILLEASSDAVLIPAHIWTPWFSVLGSKSGFDSIEECYRDLSPHIFALETGLSSDPPMNWRVSKLDRYTLVSNSDAHSASKLGREANVFSCSMSYQAIMDSLKRKTPEGFLGTLEFFPEEGKYHVDGHRNCKVSLLPDESRKLNGRCPVCKGALTLGVMYRVHELADRPMGAKPEGAFPFRSIVSLKEIIGEILDTGPASKKVTAEYDRLLNEIGPELSIILDIPLESIQKKGSAILAEAISRVRAGKIHATPGYDGEFGVIKVFDDIERLELPTTKRSIRKK